jgi:hypothetical protein
VFLAAGILVPGPIFVIGRVPARSILWGVAAHRRIHPEKFHILSASHFLLAAWFSESACHKPRSFSKVMAAFAVLIS